MHLCKTLLPGTLALLMGTTAAMADLTAQDVWDDWRANMDIYGESGVTVGGESIVGNTLTVTDLNISIDDPDQGTSVQANMPSITFTEQGDGTVLVTTSEAYTFSFQEVSEYFPDEPSSIAGQLVQDGLQIVVSGSPEELTYDLTANSYAFEITEFVDFGEAMPLEATFSLNDMTGTYVVRPGAIREISYAVAASTVDMLMTMNDPEEGIALNFNGEIADLALEADVALPEGFADQDPEEMSFAGFAIDAGYTFGGLSYAFDFDDGYDAASGTASASGGHLDLLFNETAVAYDTAVQNMAVAMQVPDFPFPINLNLAEYGITFAMPLARTEEAEPFAVGINLSELSINDEIWMMGDPTGQLPRDPITAQIGLSGEVKWLYDLLDPEQQMQMAMSDMPAEPRSVQIDALNISALGVQVTGQGGFEFDASAPGIAPGVPQAVGQVSVDAQGVNSMMDTLVSMGMLSQDDVMGARMMMGMFASASGNDGLSSSLEINAEGHVIVNGQRIQ